MDGDGEIYVRAYTKDSDLFIEVEDNGLGMQKEQVENILTDGTRIRSKAPVSEYEMCIRESSFILEQNTGWKILSEPDEGTTVRIHLPKTENVKEKKKEE